jgi:phosphate-selective porin OprO and OprP
MNSRGSDYRIYLVLALIALVAPCAFAQSEGSSGASTRRSGSEQAETAGEVDSTAKSESGKDSQAQTDLEQLKAKVEKMQALIDAQQRALAELERRLDSGAGRVQTAALPASPSSESGVILNPATAAGGTTPAGSMSPSAEASPGQVQVQNKPAPVVAGWDGRRAFLRSADGNFETYITGYAQLDFRGYQSSDHALVPPNTLLVRRARLVVGGRVQRYFDYRIEGDFADTTNTILRDFYVRVHRIDQVQLSLGQFRVPISQEELRSDAFQDFVERSLVNNLVPSRSPGIMASGALANGVFEYQIGAFNGKGLLANNNNSTPEGAVRLRFSPWKNSRQFWTEGLEFGGAYTQGRTLLSTSVRGQTESRSFTFFIPDVVNGQLNRANGELTWLLGPAAVRAEYVQTSQERENLGPGGTTLPGVVAKGSMAQFTYMLTGETKPEAGTITPRKILFGDGSGESGFGAWELKFRYSNLQISNATSKSNRAETMYFGFNWYLNRHVRHLFDIGIERFGDPVRSPNPNANNFFVLLNRFQVSF